MTLPHANAWVLLSLAASFKFLFVCFDNMTLVFIFRGSALSRTSNSLRPASSYFITSNANYIPSAHSIKPFARQNYNSHHSLIFFLLQPGVSSAFTFLIWFYNLNIVILWYRQLTENVLHLFWLTRQSFFNSYFISSPVFHFVTKFYLIVLLLPFPIINLLTNVQKTTNKLMLFTHRHHTHTSSSYY